MTRAGRVRQLAAIRVSNGPRLARRREAGSPAAKPDRGQQIKWASQGIGATLVAAGRLRISSAASAHTIAERSLQR